MASLRSEAVITRPADEVWKTVSKRGNDQRVVPTDHLVHRHR